MEIRLTGTLPENLKVLMGRLGYHENRNRQGDTSFIRRLHSLGYPRFHIYPHTTRSGVSLKLHYDEKRPSYAGSHAHSGQYDGDLVLAEAERIDTYLKSLQ
ncbi:MAG: hypothetical protein HZC01_00170 [Candidatus Kerfeldbacteria bacterium]|nr:hypothetical protein [Candidatus Kerfeldbacteria bacterium]